MKKIFVIFVVAMLTSCVATHTAIKKRNLEVKTRMSDTVFLDPVSQSKKIIYINVRNTSGDDNLNIADAIREQLSAKGFKVTDDPEKANFILQANVLQSGKSDEDSLAANLVDGVVPGVLGGAIGKNAGGDSGAVIGAVAGASIGFIGSALIEDVTYSVITDLQISQKIGSSPVDYAISAKDKKSGKVVENKGNNGKWKKYSTRVVSYANKVNLKFDEARPLLVEDLAKSVVGVF